MKKELFNAVKEQYIRSDISIPELARQIDVCQSTLYKLRQKEHWHELRNEYRSAHGLEPEPDRQNYDWIAMESEFITGDAALYEIAEKYSCPYRTVKSRAWRYQWTDKRLKYRIALGDAAAEKALELRTERQARKRYKVDWDAIKTEYVTGKMTLSELAEKHGLPVNVLNHHSKRGAWGKLRAEARERTVNETINMMVKNQAEEVSRLMPLMDKACIATDMNIDNLIDMPGVHFDELLKLSQILRNLEPVDRILSGRLTPAEKLRKEEVDTSKEEQVIRFELSPELDELAR